MSTEAQKQMNECRQAIAKEMEGMDPVAKACSTAMVLVGETICALLNRRDWEAIEEVRKVCNELFAEVDRLKNEKRNIQ
jgi:hypothetical protein